MRAAPLGALVFMTVWTGFVLYFWVIVALFWLGLPPLFGIPVRIEPSTIDLFGVSFETDSPLVAFIIATAMCIFGAIIWRIALREVLDCWHMAYGLTEQRIIIAVGEAGETRSFTAKMLSAVERSGGKTGSVWFDYEQDGESYRAGFYGIADPERVYSLIRETLIASHQQNKPCAGRPAVGENGS